MGNGGKYTCTEYREEMVLLGLRKRLEEGGLTEEERRSLMEEIERLETRMKMD